MGDMGRLLCEILALDNLYLHNKALDWIWGYTFVNQSFLSLIAVMVEALQIGSQGVQSYESAFSTRRLLGLRYLPSQEIQTGS